MHRTTVAAALAGAVPAGAEVSLIHAATAPASKAYVVAEINVTDPDVYRRYAAAAGPIVARHGGTYLVRGGATVPVEGDPPAGRIVLIEFHNLAAAKAFEASPDYLAVAALRHKAATSRVFLAEGVAR